jgi:hypothetical protein
MSETQGNEPKRAPEVDNQSDDADPRTKPFGWVGLVVIAVLVVGGWFLITTLSDDTKMQDCIQSGRRNCAPIDTAGR